MTLQWRVLSQEEMDAYEADPRTIEYRAYQRRSASNQRPRCACGRFCKFHSFDTITCAVHGKVPL